MILVVGNILKDVYLSLDSRTEVFETDKNDTKWLDVGFNCSTHHFFHRASNFGGAAVTLEVLENLGLDASVSSPNSNPSSSYRYILTSGDNVSYFVPTEPKSAIFIPPSSPVDYIYIDRSASLDLGTILKIAAFIKTSPSTKLIIYLKKDSSKAMITLAEHASLVFSEVLPESSYAKRIPYLNHDPLGLSPDKTVYISDSKFVYKQITEKIAVERIDTLTHLSAFSIASATILGSFILGASVEKGLRMAKINVENSTLNSSLTLADIKDHLFNSIDEENLELIAASLLTPKKGILAIDESNDTIKKRFEKLGIKNSLSSRHEFRNLLLTTNNLERYLNGIFLCDETARDFMNTGESVPDYIISHRIIPGIKADQGTELIYGEAYTKGLESLLRRLQEYREMGLRFAKWRACFKIKKDESNKIVTPSQNAITRNCESLAKFAAICEEAGFVPILEPELLLDGDHSIEDSATNTSKILDQLFKELRKKHVNLSSCILKINMITPGKDSEEEFSPEQIGHLTAEVIKIHIPDGIAGVTFLSGGQTPEEATTNFAEILKNGPFPWPVTFSFARALEESALHIWHGNEKNIEAAKSAFKTRLELIKAAML